MKIVISASRRTDIPAFYLDDFTAQLERGYFEVKNPYNGRVSTIPASAERVHTIVFWSKNYDRFLDRETGERLRAGGYNLFFNFTVNSTAALLEPAMPPLERRLVQLAELARRFGPASIHWRFDPICFYRPGPGSAEKNNLADFETIAAAAAAAGIERCITSFLDLYAKIIRRTAALPGFAFVDPPPARKAAVLLAMERTLRRHGILLTTCCEKEVLATLPADSTVSAGACIPNDLLLQLYGGEISLRPDAGQRRRQGCGCRVSVDIGSYREQPCRHGCLYCYANPVKYRPTAEAQGTRR
jgi:hypothetical protein